MIPQRARKLNKTDGFIEEYRKLVGDGASGLYAYNMLEREYYNYFGYFRYADYNSFYQTMYQKERNENKAT
jgi:hypothetical protein